jgi:SAM-dependent methyltransferase
MDLWGMLKEWKQMDNPWLNIPASDYEGHMNLPEVNQLSFLGNVFKESLAKYNNNSIAYLGCATGNGLEYISSEKTHKLTAIDINPEYLEILRNRFQSKIPSLETIEADLNDYQGNNQRYSLVFAGLIFEYLPSIPLLKKISNWLKKAGVMVVVLQLQDKHTKKVSDTPYSSLKQLDPIMKLISDRDFKLMAMENELMELEGKIITLESRKTFYIGAYGKSA